MSIRAALAVLAILAVARADRAQLVELSIPPLSTEPALSGWLTPHFACWDPALAPRDELFVFLHGLDGSPGACKNLIRTAARAGYRAVGITYPCSWVPFQFCNTSADPDCYENLRLEIFDGVDHSPWIAVPSADSIENRLAKLLAHLQTTAPEQNWSSFLDGGTTAWSRVVLYGHSQGGTNAAVIARHRVVARAILSAPPADASQALGGYAPWWSTHATPSASYFGFVHAQDALSTKLAVWSLLGMAPFGPAYDVATVGAPFSFTHQLQTTLAPALAGQYHNSVATDATTPLGAGGKPVYEPVWRHLISGGEHVLTPQLGADKASLSVAAGGAVHWSLNAGSQHAGHAYWIAGSLSGVAPGLDLGAVHLPLNVDAWTLVTVTQPNQGPFGATLGVLDALGRAGATLSLPPLSDPSLVGVQANHAYVVLDAWTPVAASNAQTLVLN
ncbi:MAG: hypothetical protein FJ299_03270 [Planctomycetes bacterium]|nr:hypothetical protein [Planctomycetota bacterium]